MKYKDAEIVYGAITAPTGISVPGWIITRGSRRTIAATKELAQAWVDIQARKDEREHT